MEYVSNVRSASYSKIVNVKRSFAVLEKYSIIEVKNVKNAALIAPNATNLASVTHVCHRLFKMVVESALNVWRILIMMRGVGCVSRVKIIVDNVVGRIVVRVVGRLLSLRTMLVLRVGRDSFIRLRQGSVRRVGIIVPCVLTRKAVYCVRTPFSKEPMVTASVI